MDAHVPAVSVGVPAYNAEAYLTTALDHLRSQEFEDFEVIISDNASTDRTEAISRSFAEADHRFRYYRSEVNRGLPWNFNRTLELARAPLFTWNSADDMAGPQHLSTCIQALRDHPEAPIAFSRVQLVDRQGVVIGTANDDGVNVDGPRPRDRVRQFLGPPHLLQAIGYGGMFRTDALCAVGGLPSYYGGDVALGVVLAMRGAFVSTGERNFMWRRHDAQATNLQTAALGTQRAAFVPGSRARLAFPAWRLTAEILRAIGAERQFSLAERAACMGAALRLWSLKQWRAFPYDIKRNLQAARRRRRVSTT